MLLFVALRLMFRCRDRDGCFATVVGFARTSMVAFHHFDDVCFTISTRARDMQTDVNPVQISPELRRIQGFGAYDFRTREPVQRQGLSYSSLMVTRA